jgi:integrase
VTDEEYTAVYERAGGYIRLAMEFAYLCRLRRVEIIGPNPADITPEGSQHTGIIREHVLDEGLRVIRSKGSKEQIIAWTPRLRAAVDMAKTLPGAISTKYLIHNQQGQRIRVHAFESAWRRAVKKAVKETGIETFHFHDLKAKGVSDFDGDKMKASGHKSLKMVAVYDRKVEVVAPTK